LHKTHEISFQTSQGYLSFLCNNDDIPCSYLMFRNTFRWSHDIRHQSCDDQCLKTSHEENSSRLRWKSFFKFTNEFKELVKLDFSRGVIIFFIWFKLVSNKLITVLVFNHFIKHGKNNIFHCECQCKCSL